jgi:hypothetical protein
MSVKLPVTCRRGHSVALEESALAAGITITNHTARGTLKLSGGRESAGAIAVSLDFTAAGSLEGRLSVHIAFRGRRMGLCSKTLKFTART